MDEEFPNYEKLLYDMTVDPTHVTLAYLPSMADAPSSSGQKCSRVIPTDGEGDIEDRGSSSTGGRLASDASGIGLASTTGLHGTGRRRIPPNLAHANAVTAFVASLLIPEPNQLRVDPISALLALAVDGPIHKAAIKLLAPAYS